MGGGNSENPLNALIYYAIKIVIIIIITHMQMQVWMLIIVTMSVVLKWCSV